MQRSVSEPLTLRPESEGLYPTSVRVFGGRAIAADPWVGPVGDLALVLGQMRAPGVSLDRLLGLPDYVELTVRPDLPDHARLRQLVVRAHDRDEAGGRRHL